MVKDKRKQAQPKGKTDGPPIAAASTPPAWPVFKPLLPVAELSFETLVPDKVVLVRNFFPRSLCRDYVSFLRSLPLTTTPGKPRRGEAVRVNDRFQVDDAGFANRLWLETGLKEALLREEDDGPGALWSERRSGRFEPQHKNLPLFQGNVLRLSLYVQPLCQRGLPVRSYIAAGILQQPRCYIMDVPNPRKPDDDSNNMTLSTPSGNVSCKTTWTLLLYLTSAADGCVGGETVFHPNDRQSAKEEIAVPPETGMLLLHKHGDDCMLHEGREVKAGEKWVLRTDLCVRKSG